MPVPEKRAVGARDHARDLRDGLHPRVRPRGSLGPCYRCLGDAVLEIPNDLREYQAESPDDEELTTRTSYGNELELSDWARDAVALALPEKILCRPDCAGLCGTCGRNLNDEPHTHEEAHSDPRWAALEALREQS